MANDQHRTGIMRQRADIVIVAFLMIVPVCSEIPVPVFCRRQPLVILEKFNEGVFIFKPAHPGDRLQRIIGIEQ